MVVVFIVLVIVVTVSNPGVIRVSWREKADPGVTTFLFALGVQQGVSIKSDSITARATYARHGVARVRLM